MKTKGIGEKRQNKMRKGRYISAAFLAAFLVVVGIPYAGIGSLKAEAAATPINSTTFPDKTFRAYVSENFDTDGDESLSDTEKNAVTNISVSQKSIYSMVGVENFKNLKILYCFSTQISSLDVSQNTALEVLSCHSTQISSLDVSKNTALEGLSCFRTQISSLDVSKNTALRSLNCSGTQISSLDVSQNIALETLACSSTQISSLDVSENTALEDLRCDSTQISSLDVSQNTALKTLNCSGNRFSNGTSFFDTAGLNGFDLSKASNWINASISGTVVTAIDMSSPVTYTYDCGNNHSATFTFLPTPVIYTVSFNANGGSCDTSSKNVTYGSTYGTLPTPTRTGYSFSSWYTSANGGSRVTSKQYDSESYRKSDFVRTLDSRYIHSNI